MFSKTDKNIVEFIYGNESIVKIFIFIYFLPTYEIFSKLIKKKNFLPFKSNYNDEWDHIIKKKNLTTCKKILINKIRKNKKKISTPLIKLKNEKYILIHIKHYNNEINNLNFANSRQTCNFKKVFKVINFIKKKYKIVILGINTDRSIRILKNKFQKHANIYFFNDLSKNYSIHDQMFCYYYSRGYIGSAAGMIPILWVLNKKIILFDLSKDSIDERYRSKKFLFIFKKYFFKKNKKIKILDDKAVEKLKTINFKKNKYEILEVDANKIIKKFKTFF